MAEGCEQGSQDRYFFPSVSKKDDLVFARWPLRLDRLAASYHNAFLDVFSPSTRPQFKDGFRLFPAMMLFRHAVELLLKAIVKDVCNEQPPTNTHDLVRIFEIHVRPILPDRAILPQDEEFVRQALAELQDKDSGDAFRYGLDNKMREYFDNSPETVDHRKLYGVCERLWGILWRVHGPVRMDE